MQQVLLREKAKYEQTGTKNRKNLLNCCNFLNEQVHNNHEINLTWSKETIKQHVH